jgi:hypothetical protein
MREKERRKEGIGSDRARGLQAYLLPASPTPIPADRQQSHPQNPAPTAGIRLAFGVKAALEARIILSISLLFAF